MMSPISSLKYSSYSNEIILAASDSVKTTNSQIDTSSDSPTSLLNVVNRSKTHFSSDTPTSRSRRAKKRLALRKSEMDASKVKDEQQTHQDSRDYLSMYQLQSQSFLRRVLRWTEPMFSLQRLDLIIRIERIPKALTVMALGNGEKSESDGAEKVPMAQFLSVLMIEPVCLCLQLTEHADQLVDIPSMVPCLSRIIPDFTNDRSDSNGDCSQAKCLHHNGSSRHGKSPTKHSCESVTFDRSGTTLEHQRSK